MNLVRQLDEDWMAMMKDARSLGLHPDEIRAFLRRRSLLLERNREEKRTLPDTLYPLDVPTVVL